MNGPVTTAPPVVTAPGDPSEADTDAVPAEAAPRSQGRPVRSRWIEPLQGAGLITTAVLLALGLAAVILLLDGRSPSTAFTVAWEGSVGDWVRIGVTANRAVPFVIAGLGFLIAYRAGLLNVGAEGQIYLGAAAAGAVALKTGIAGGPFGFTVALLAAAAAGAAISLVAAVLYVWRGVSIVLSTLLLNFVGIQIVSYLVRTPSLLQESGAASGTGDASRSGTDLGAVARAFPQSDPIAQDWKLPRLVEGNQAHVGILLAVALVATVVVLLRVTKLGFHIKVLGASAAAAHHGGIPVRRTTYAAMALCGALGGVAGAVIVLGDRFRVLEVISEDYGFIAILAVLLARSSPVGTVAAAFLFAALQRGGQIMESSGVAPSSTVLIVQCTIVLLIACGIEIERRHRARVSARGA